MRKPKTLFGLILLALCTTLTGCSNGPEPSYIAPVAITSVNGVAAVAFCEDIDVLRLSLSQELQGSNTGFVRIFDGEIEQQFKAGDSLTLDGEIAALDPRNELSKFSTVEGTSYVISTSTPSGGGFVGVIVNAPADWVDGQWLPTESEPSADPCDFWDSL